METVEQVNEDFNVKKPKKKGVLIGGIIAVALVIAVILIYFLVLTKPEFIFSKAIDKIFKVESEQYNSIKFDSKIKVSVEAEDESLQDQLAEIEKCTLKLGAQMDISEKKEIVDLGLEYDNEEVIDAQVYYNDGDMYAYFEGLFDKYIEIDMDEETKEQMNEIFESATSEEDLKKSEKVVKIFRDELKAQIKEEGTFEQEKETIDIGDKEQKVTKSTLTLSEKQLLKVLSNVCSNLAENDEFVEFFEDDTVEEDLKELAELIEETEANSKNKVEISIYTKGLNKVVAIDVQVYVEEEATTIIMLVVKEDENLYSYNVSGKMSGAKVDLLNGKVEIKKDKDSKEEQSGKAIITGEVFQTGNAKLEIDYSLEYDKGVDKINTKNSVNINELTEEDINSIMTELMERPLIGELISSQMNGLNTEIEDNIIDGADVITQNTLTTSQNEVRNEDYGYSVTYSVPAKFVYDSDYSYDDTKYYELENADYSYIDARVSIDWYTEDEYVEDEIDSSYEYWNNSTDYTNVVLSDVGTITVGDKQFKYQTISYESDYGYGSKSKYQDVYVWYALDDEYLFTVELEATDTTITEDVIKGFLNISVKEI